MGQVGQNPVQKKLRSGRTVTLLSIGTGGIRNNRRPLENEEPKDYANRCAVQWHRVSIYREKLGEVAIKHVTPGSVFYYVTFVIQLLSLGALNLLLLVVVFNLHVKKHMVRFRAA